ncbi:hypothetical protein [Streptomyces sp. NPDC101237]|uniref:hypothetical protein n=1 Tax=Streptomyces sp. NPDC101237 TaxID=3366139 RepID=UPI0037FDCBDD
MKKTLRDILPLLLTLFLANTSLRVYEGLQHEQSWSQVILKIAIGAILALVAPVMVLLVIRARNRKKNSSPALDDEGI